MNLKRWMQFSLAALALVMTAVLAACSGGGSSSAPPPTAISGTVTFPAASGAAKVVAAATTAPTLEIRDLSGVLIATVSLTLQSGNTYSYPATNLPTGRDYVLKAVNGNMVLRALVDKAALIDTTTTRDVNSVTTTALIVVERALNLTAGTLGVSASNTQVQEASAALALTSPPATIESSITEAIAACTSTSGTATSDQAQLASLANIVTAAVSNNVDPSAFMAGTDVTTFDAVTYTVSGTTATGSSASVNTSSAGAFVAAVVQMLPQISSAGTASFTVGQVGSIAITGTGTLNVSGTLPTGVSFDAATGLLAGTPATGSNGVYTLTVTATSNGLSATQAFTLTVNPNTPSTTGFTTAMLSGKTFTEGDANTLAFNANGTLIASDTTDSLTWSINSSGQVVVQNSTSNTSTTITFVSGNLTTGMTVTLSHSDATTESTTITQAAAPVTGFTTGMLSGKVFDEGQANTLAFNANGTLAASDTTDALTWSVNSSGQVVVQNTTNNTSTTITFVSGNLTTGMAVTLRDSDGTTESTTIALKPNVVISGAMRSDDGANVPAPGLTITARHASDVNNSNPIAQTTSGADGSYTLSVPYGSDVYLNASGTSGGVQYASFNTKIWRNLTGALNVMERGGPGVIPAAELNTALGATTCGTGACGSTAGKGWFFQDVFSDVDFTINASGVSFAVSPSLDFFGYDNGAGAYTATPALTSTVLENTMSSALGYSTTAKIISVTASKSGTASQSYELPIIPGESVYIEIGY